MFAGMRWGSADYKTISDLNVTPAVFIFLLSDLLLRFLYLSPLKEAGKMQVACGCMLIVFSHKIQDAIPAYIS